MVTVVLTDGWVSVSFNGKTLTALNIICQVSQFKLFGLRSDLHDCDRKRGGEGVRPLL